MRKTYAFVMTSLDGYYVDDVGALDWNIVDEEFMAWNIAQNRATATVMLGRLTFDHFEEFWTSEEASRTMPDVASYMGEVPKVLVSTTASEASWNNTSIDSGDDLAQTIKRLREEVDGDIGIFGSTRLTVALLEQGVLDELRVVPDPARGRQEHLRRAPANRARSRRDQPLRIGQHPARLPTATVVRRAKPRTRSPGACVTDRPSVVRQYLEAFSRDDRQAVLGLLTDDVRWDIHGRRHLQGKDEFASEIQGEGFEANPALELDRLIESGDTIVAPHLGRVARSDGPDFEFAAVDIFTFRGGLIERVESWVVPVDEPG